jgi:hypothetical protein
VLVFTVKDILLLHFANSDRPHVFCYVKLCHQYVLFTVLPSYLTTILCTSEYGRFCFTKTRVSASPSGHYAHRIWQYSPKVQRAESIIRMIFYRFCRWRMSLSELFNSHTYDEKSPSGLWVQRPGGLLKLLRVLLPVKGRWRTSVVKLGRPQ